MFLKKYINGFTLIELLAVILILAILLLIAVPLILDIFQNTVEKTYNKQEKIISRSAENYVLINNQKLNSGQELIIPFNELENFINEVRDSSTNNICDGYVVVNNIAGVYDYKTYINCDEYTTPGYQPSPIYGVTFNPTTGVVGTRTDAAVGMNFTVNASTINSDFDTAEIYKDIKEVVDGYGNIFIEIPKFYIKKTKTGNVWTYQISKVKHDENYYLPVSFYNVNTDDIANSVWIGKYFGSLNVDKLESKSGVSPLDTVNFVNFRTYAKNNGPGYQLIDIHAHDILTTLFYIEFATLDAQSIMSGYTAASNPRFPNANGGTDSVATASGSPTSNSTGTHPMKYRGVENFYGRMEHFIDGININERVAYVSKNPSTYASAVFTGDYQPIGYTNGSVNGYVSDMGFDPNYPFIQLPISASSNLYKDYYEQTTGQRIAAYGGFWTRGDRAGPSNWILHASHGTTFWEVGSRLVKTNY